MKKSRLNPAVKPIIIWAVILLALVFVARASWYFLRTSQYFNIKEVFSREGIAAEPFSYLKGKNIFGVQLRKETMYLSQFFPEYRSVRLFRLLPDRIFVDFIKRLPVAQVKLYRYFSLDQDGVFFSSSEQPDQGLPVITGLETRIFGPKPGKKFNVKELSLALNIVKEINKKKLFKSYPVKKIDVASPSSALVFVYLSNKPDLLEVRLPQENVKDKVDMLSGIISAGRNELANFKYIDLRFKEPVIKLKDAK